MNSVEKLNIPTFFSTNESAFLSDQKDVLQTRYFSQNFFVGIYLMGENRFLYFNEGLREIVGEHFSKILREGWNFWFSLINPKSKSYIQDQISNFYKVPYLKKKLTLNYNIFDVFGKEIGIKHQILVHPFDNHFLAINFFLDTTKKEKKDQFFRAKPIVRNYEISKKTSLKISTREKEVLGLIGKGFSSKQIADMLFISNHTVISHRKNLISKFNAKNTAQLIKKACEIMSL